MRDLREIPDDIKKDLEIKPVKWIEEVLKIALEHMPEPIPDEEYLAGMDSNIDTPSDGASRINTH